MTITIDPRALTATVLILLALYLFVRRDGLRLMIMTVMMFFVSYFNLARDLPREAVISAMLERLLLFCILCIVSQESTKRKSA